VEATAFRVERSMLAAEEPLEVLRCPDSEGGAGAPLLFVHGGYVAAWCWEDHFLPWFAARGHPVAAVSLRGHGRSGGHERLDSFGLAEYARDVAAVAKTLPRAPVLVGHSMGGLVVQKFLEAEGRGAVAGAALLCPVASFGLMPATIALAFTRPGLFAGIHGLAAGHGGSLEALAEAMFAQPIAPERLARVFGRMRRESRHALMEMSGFGLPQHWRVKAPAMLAVAAEKDLLTPAAGIQSSAWLLGAEYRLLAGMGHAVMLEEGWMACAEALAEWIDVRLAPDGRIPPGPLKPTV
jgi:non-heme chloroperoxidase